MVDRVRRPESYKDFMDKFAKNPDTKVFETLKDCLVFSAALGYKNNARESFDKGAESILLQVFGGDDMAFINALAIIDSDDSNLISPDRLEEKIRIFEEYACGGLKILQSRLGQIDQDINLVKIMTDEMGEHDLVDNITNF